MKAKNSSNFNEQVVALKNPMMLKFSRYLDKNKELKSKPKN